ncbi:unnamed protein product, partial [Ectocarpus sp. 8 AP-2014]
PYARAGADTTVSTSSHKARHGGGGAPRGRNRWAGASARPRGTAIRPPRPTHFLSVRIDNPQIWAKISTIQGDILAGNQHLTDAAIPVQASHLTIFVLTLSEKDGSLQQARDTLQHCGDLLLEHGLSPEVDLQASASRTECVPDDGVHPAALGIGDSNETAPGATAASPLTLSFRDLGHFRNKVLFAKLAEDEQATRLRGLASSLHRRFSEAGLVEEAAGSPSRKGGKRGDGDGGGGSGSGSGNSSDSFEFTPHLTIMKTSKLRDRGTLIPADSYDRYQNGFVVGHHAPSSVELSSMLEKEDVPPLEGWEPRPYYKCEHRLGLCTPAV